MDRAKANAVVSFLCALCGLHCEGATTNSRVQQCALDAASLGSPDVGPPTNLDDLCFTNPGAMTWIAPNPSDPSKTDLGCREPYAGSGITGAGDAGLPPTTGVTLTISHLTGAGCELDAEFNIESNVLDSLWCYGSCAVTIHAPAGSPRHGDHVVGSFSCPDLSCEGAFSAAASSSFDIID
jgi:hypothetical protein